METLIYGVIDRIDMVLQEAEKPKEPVPEYDISLQHTHFRKDDPIAISTFGKKKVNAETSHWDEIGKNPSICRKLYGLGSILNDLNMGFNFNNLDNHVWIKQLNTKSNKTMQICFNCGSLKIDGRFIAYTDLKQ